MLIARKDEVEHYLTELFLEANPEVIGNSYLIFGTVEKKAWREDRKQPKPFAEMLQHIHDFRGYQEIRMTMAGWFYKDQEPPVMEPPPSTEWVK
jgi:hypothetical protein